MRLSYRIMLMLALTMLSTSWLFAQRDYGYGRGWGGYNRYHSSTAAEGYARGMADVVRSAGEANLMNSEALKNVEQARKQNIENRVSATQAYFEKKRINEAYRQSHTKPRPSAEELARYRLARQPNRLGSGQLDPLTGEIQWPAVLLEDSFAKVRKRLNGMFKVRAEQSYFTPQQAVQARQVTNQMQEQLAQSIRAKKFDPAASVQAVGFLRSLKFEIEAEPS